ncbi:MAG TPA: DUF2652 domain-containing protein [Burkholderiales bacterium]
MAHAPSNDVLFFIPDISGFTKFVASTEIEHSQTLIQMLLEGLVDANQLGLKVLEYEGDAVLFCRTGSLPALGDFVAQAKKMFVGFHETLKKFEASRQCECGACKGAAGLTLKIVAHAGPARTLKVKDSEKFIGTGVIIAHRLLKNSVPEREYLLLTGSLCGPAGNADAGEFRDGKDSYDEIGPVDYRYLPLAKFRGELKESAQ